MKVDFGAFVGQVAKGRIATLGIVMGYVVADFALGFFQTEKTTTIEQFGFEAAPKRFCAGCNTLQGHCKTSRQVRLRPAREYPATAKPPKKYPISVRLWRRFFKGNTNH
nr:hypothetical protein [Hymenobacter sp. PAMC 26628]